MDIKNLQNMSEDEISKLLLESASEVNTILSDIKGTLKKSYPAEEIPKEEAPAPAADEMSAQAPASDMSAESAPAEMAPETGMEDQGMEPDFSELSDEDLDQLDMAIQAEKQKRMAASAPEGMSADPAMAKSADELDADADMQKSADMKESDDAEQKEANGSDAESFSALKKSVESLTETVNGLVKLQKSQIEKKKSGTVAKVAASSADNFEPLKKSAKNKPVEEKARLTKSQTASFLINQLEQKNNLIKVNDMTKLQKIDENDQESVNAFQDILNQRGVQIPFQTV